MVASGAFVVASGKTSEDDRELVLAAVVLAKDLDSEISFGAGTTLLLPPTPLLVGVNEGLQADTAVLPEGEVFPAGHV